jgi:hypothetical protein
MPSKAEESYFFSPIFCNRKFHISIRKWEKAILSVSGILQLPKELNVLKGNN